MMVLAEESIMFCVLLTMHNHRAPIRVKTTPRKWCPSLKRWPCVRKSAKISTPLICAPDRHLAGVMRVIQPVNLTPQIIIGNVSAKCQGTKMNFGGILGAKSAIFAIFDQSLAMETPINPKTVDILLSVIIIYVHIYSHWGCWTTSWVAQFWK